MNCPVTAALDSFSTSPKVHTIAPYEAFNHVFKVSWMRSIQEAQY